MAAKKKEPITWYVDTDGPVHTIPEGATVVFQVPGHELRVSILNDNTSIVWTQYKKKTSAKSKRPKK
jgi:hypothetical protein